MTKAREKRKLYIFESTRLGLRFQPTVFAGAAMVIILFVTVSLAFLEQMSQVFDATQAFIARGFGWFYVLSVNAFLGFVVFLLFSRYGSIRLDAADTKPEFTYWAWFAMLFSAGMGIGLVFYSVAEPILHYVNPPIGEGRTTEAAERSMIVTYLHWGLHCWAIYAVVGLGLAFFGFTRGLPLTIRSAFYPLLGDRIYGPVGHLVDIIAAVATLFGLATSLGLGVQQINAGLGYLFGLAENVGIQVLLIAVITSFATISVVLGIDRGIRRLSILNMWMALLLLAFIFLVGPTLFILNSFVQTVGRYLAELPDLASWMEAYQGTTWQHDWTIFYWGWWIAWSPFVGMFIARISRGRTVREYLLGVVLVPTLMTFVWLSVFGDTALYVELFGGGGIAPAVEENIAVALFALFEKLPLAFLSSAIGILVVVIFFVSSSDSASLVVDIVTAGGRTNPPRKQRVFWAVSEGVVAAVLLLGGGLQALRTASISTGLPFAVVLLLLCVGLVLGLKRHWAQQQTAHAETLTESSVHHNAAPANAPTPDPDLSDQ